MRGLAIFKKSRETLLLYEPLNFSGDGFRVAASKENLNFTPLKEKPKIILAARKQEKISQCSNFSVSEIHDGFFLTYKSKRGARAPLVGAFSKDGIAWKETGEISSRGEKAVLVPHAKMHGRYILFSGEKHIKIGYSKNFKEWEFENDPILSPRSGQFDSSPIKPIAAFVNNDGIVLLYETTQGKGKSAKICVGAVQLDRNNPMRVLWRSEEPLWRQKPIMEGRRIYPLGFIENGSGGILYWGSLEGELFGSVLSFRRREVRTVPFHHAVRLEKHHRNPIIVPTHENQWESIATMNPAALYAGGKIHILYRAIGAGDISVLGYASSSDGLHIDERLQYPAYVPRAPFEGCTGEPRTYREKSYSPFMSGGGGSGGCEDPRMTQIDDRIYMTYVAYNGWSEPRVALTSIAFEDFLQKVWSWTQPVLISPLGVIDKNACILPEKIDGKYVIFHRIFPNIQIDLVDSLDFDGKTKWLKKDGDYVIRPRKEHWDSRKIGVGAPPIKTDDGWLLIYQGMGGKDGTSSPYNLGAMLLDLKEPWRVIARSTHPILEPDEWYENQGHKAAVAYPCGAVVMNDRLYVYYGGADTVVCVAQAPLKSFLANLLQHKEAKLEPMVLGTLA